MEVSVPFVKTNRHSLLTAVLLVALVVAGSGWSAPRQASASGVWQQAEVITSGLAASTPRYFEPYSVSCPTAGNCAAVGRYDNASGGTEALVMNSVGGVWGQATGVTFPGGVQNASPSSVLYEVSCPTVGNCVAVGRYRNAAGGFEGFIVSSSGGTWGTAQTVAFAGGVQNANPNTTVFSVSCAAVGECAAVGYFIDAANKEEAFTVTQSGGTWGTAAPVVFAGGVQNAAPDARLNSVSCGAVGDCSAGGYVYLASGNYEAFTVTLSGGTWGNGQPVVFGGGVRDATSPFDMIESMSCPAAGNCTAGGFYVNAAGRNQPFTVTMTAGTWATAVPVVFDGSVVQSGFADARVYRVSCSSTGNCAATGKFRNANSDDEVFVMASTGGTWASATAVTFAVGVQNPVPSDRPYGLSCASTGNCTVGGYFRNVAGGTQGLTVDLVSGVWQTARPVQFAGGVQDASPDERVASVSCPSTGNCTVVGYVKTPGNHYDAFAASLVDNTPPTTTAPTTTVAATTTTAAPTTTTATTAPATTTTVAATTTVPPISAKSGSTSAQITFTSTTPEAQVKAYEYSLDGGKTWKRGTVTKLDDGRLSLTVEGLDSGTDYEAAIRVVGTSGAVTSAGVVSFTTSDLLPETGLQVGALWLTALLMIASGGTVVAGRRRFIAT